MSSSPKQNYFSNSKLRLSICLCAIIDALGIQSVGELLEIFELPLTQSPRVMPLQLVQCTGAPALAGSSGFAHCELRVPNHLQRSVSGSRTASIARPKTETKKYSPLPYEADPGARQTHSTPRAPSKCSTKELPSRVFALAGVTGRFVDAIHCVLTDVTRIAFEGIPDDPTDQLSSRGGSRGGCHRGVP